MKTIQVKLGKPSKFYVNKKRISLNTAFGMYQKGAKFTNNLDKLPDDLYREISKLVFHPNTEIPKYMVTQLNPLQRVEKYMNKKGELHRVGGPAVITHTENGPVEKKWYQNNQLHRVGGPAVESSYGDQWWYKKGKLHRDGDKPAWIGWTPNAGGYDERIKVWSKNGKTHRDGDKPARIVFQSSDDSPRYEEQWFKKGKEHRDGDKPSFINHFEDNNERLTVSLKRWMKNGKLHRGQGKPAIENWQANGDHFPSKSYAFEGLEFPSRAAYTKHRNSIRNTALRTAGAHLRRRAPIREIMGYLDLIGEEEPLSSPDECHICYNSGAKRRNCCTYKTCKQCINTIKSHPNPSQRTCPQCRGPLSPIRQE
jgi:hypothetical protein